MADLDELRQRINAIDRQMLALFQERMQVAADIAQYKRENGLPVLDPAREREKLAAATNAVPDELRDHAAVLMSLLMETSRAHQHTILGDDTPDAN